MRAQESPANRRARPRIAIFEHWQDLNVHLKELVALVPDDKLDWSPSPQEWGFRSLFVHIAAARHHWLNVSVTDGDSIDDIHLRTSANKEELQAILEDSWQRLAEFLQDERRLDATCSPPPNDPPYLDPPVFDGHFVAFHRLIPIAPTYSGSSRSSTSSSRRTGGDARCDSAWTAGALAPRRTTPSQATHSGDSEGSASG